MNDFSPLIRSWYRLNKRDLPWRNTIDPYQIWLSEIIMQQTRVEQGLKYYLKFIQNYPTILDLANAKEQSILNDWQGLGYYSRARNLHHSAKVIRDEYKGVFPKDFKTLIKLKGVGVYTASAISSFANNEDKAVVDGNVYRFLSRVFDIDTAIDSTEGIKLFQELANDLLDTKKSGEHNQAIMEMGALICT
ncbi:MAG: A/G-specific adenine glycosylase, partial [Flavobacteriales bacterium]